MMTNFDKAKSIQDWVIAVRRDFHRHPELSNKEYRTADQITTLLTEMHIETTRIGDTGVVGTIHGKNVGKVIALRSDIDALPVTEVTGYSFASETPGIMHACGHDGHMASLLGAAKILSETKDEWAGTIKLIFQPAEEAGVGATQMIEAGVLDNPKVESIIGMHLYPQLPTGVVAIQAGPLFASGDLFTLEVLGEQCHGSSPWLGVDAIVATSAIILNLQTIVSRMNDVRKPIGINVGTILGGDRQNITPGRVYIEGSNRAFNETIRKQLPTWMENIIKGTCEAYRCTYNFSYEPLIGAVNNDEALTNIIREPIRMVLGNDHVVTTQPLMGSEDFSFYQFKIPGTFMLLGCGNKQKDCIYSMHSDHYKFDEDALQYSVTAFVEAALACLK